MSIPERNFSLDLVRVTEAAALASARWLGKGNTDAGDGAAVDAMRVTLNNLNIKGRIIIGEGEKDNAPMLYNGEAVGAGSGPALDIAMDPVEGTKLLAYGRPNAISVVGATPKGSMYDPGPSFYMEKLVVPPEARNVADLDAPVEKRGVGGLGNLLVGRLVDVSDYVRTGSANVLTLRFRRDASPR